MNPKFEVGEIVLMEDVFDKNVFHDVQYRGNLDVENSVVIFKDFQMKVETSRLKSKSKKFL